MLALLKGPGIPAAILHGLDAGGGRETSGDVKVGQLVEEVLDSASPRGPRVVPIDVEGTRPGGNGAGGGPEGAADGRFGVVVLWDSPTGSGPASCCFRDCWPTSSQECDAD